MSARHAPARLWLALWTGASLLSGLWPDSSFEPRLERSLLPPGAGHWLGSDPLGRDLLLLLLRSSFVSLSFAALATACAVVGALALASTIALGPRFIRPLLGRGLEASLAFPSLLLALAIATVRGPGMGTLFICLTIGIAPGLARLLAARAVELLAEPYILAARACGARDSRIAAFHLGPALLGLARLKAPSLFAQALMAEATLSFLGIGAPVGRPSWGALLAVGKDYLFEAPYIAVGTGVPLVLTILAIQTLLDERPAGRVQGNTLGKGP